MTKTYEYKEGFMIDITSLEDVIEVYLYHKDFGVKSHMFGLLKKDIESEKMLRDLISANLEDESIIDDYRMQYMD